ncbi:MAG: sigma-54-dependent Fis family transcriptional regulator [Bdellovibrionales bacterium]|nr:sigma-54-dependent Fis family transcriptional regulator [Bdellovibrionales bacterium]
MQSKRVLIVDDEASLRTALFRALDRRGYQVITAASCKEAEMVSQTEKPIDLALIDLRLPDGDGIELMSQIKTYQKNAQVIILTGFGSIDTAIKATRRGAFHFVTKPFNLDEILSLTERALNQSSLEKENYQLRSALQTKYRFDNIIGQSDQILGVLKLIERVADSDSTVLVTGESGTGKELVAKAIHYNSSRKNKPFVPINCGAIPGELLESELFGHIKGAFTGAISNRMGRFEMAEEGTIFLDEIGDMSPTLQVKLLRVLQERRFEAVGSTKTIEANVRVIAATNIDLDRAVAEGRFREDLFYRLNVIPIQIPSLKERRSDIPLLITHFIESFNKSRSRNLSGLTDAAMEHLYNYPWPGNIRELENLIERIAILKGQGMVGVEDLPEKYQNHTAIQSKNHNPVDIPEAGMDFNSAVDNYENTLILKALEKTGWNRNQAALLLKLNRTTLVEKIKKKGLRPPEASA